jgi:ABC-type multidrug transport system permease subunit
MVSDRSPRLDVQVQLLTPASTQYHWGPFVTGLIVSEFPYLIVCALLYYVCWYFAPVLNTSAYSAGSVFFVIVSLEALLAILSLMSY